MLPLPDDRAYVCYGQYTGDVAFEASDGQLIVITVTMRVGQQPVGQAGALYAIVLDPLTQQTINGWGGNANEGRYNISIDGLVPGFL